MNDDDEIQADVPNQSTQIERDTAFCARMLKAIEAGLESAPIGVVTTPPEPKIPNTFQQSLGH